MSVSSEEEEPCGGALFQTEVEEKEEGGGGGGGEGGECHESRFLPACSMEPEPYRALSAVGLTIGRQRALSTAARRQGPVDRGFKGAVDRDA